MITEWQKDWFRVGDIGIIRVGHDQRSMAKRNGKQKLIRGIYALIEVIGLPKPETDFRSEKKGQVRYYVGIRYLRNYFNNPILLTELQNHFAVEKDPYLLPGHQASSMPLCEEVFNTVLIIGEGRSSLLPK
jgi:hypothetical protein